MAVVLDGKKLAEKILADLSKELKNSLPAGRQGGKEFKLVAVLVGDDPQSKIFLRQKEKACKKIGVDFKLYQLPEDISQEKLTKKVKELRYKLCHGVIIQLPLPNHIDTPKILDLVPAEKDVDRRPISPVLAGILALLKEYRISFQNKKVAVVGRGRLVGQPVMEWLRKRHIEVVNDTKEADIVISGVGKPGFVITGNMIKRGAVVVDAAGDVDQKTVAKKASYITPTPGGVGPMTVAMLLKNLVILTKRKEATI